MKKVFADSAYWIALINPKDQILTETLNYYAESGEHFRGIVSREIEKILFNQNIEIIEATHENFLDGFELYRNRLDKGYSLTDCISMNAMREHDINEILTHDHHFKQEGFQTLL